MSVFYTSDTHFGHANVIHLCGRPYEDVVDMNLDMVERWNSVVGPDDVVYVLGDVVLGRFDDSMAYIPELNGFKILLPGNHDKCWHGTSKGAEKYTQAYLDGGFDMVISDAYESATTEIDGRPVMMCHFPWRGDHSADDRYEIHRLTDDGRSFLLCGHVHDAWRQRGRQINVGIDAWGGYPVHEDVLAELMAHGERDLDCIQWVA